MADSKKRNLVVSAWAHALEAEQLPTSFDPDSQSPFGVQTSLVSEEVAYAWCNNGLPAKSVSILTCFLCAFVCCGSVCASFVHVPLGADALLFLLECLLMDKAESRWSRLS